jgi:hypothetical protein
MGSVTYDRLSKRLLERLFGLAFLARFTAVPNAEQAADTPVSLPHLPASASRAVAPTMVLAPMYGHCVGKQLLLSGVKAWS